MQPVKFQRIAQYGHLSSNFFPGGAPVLRLPMYSSFLGYHNEQNRLADKFSNEIKSLNAREISLAQKMAEAQKNAPGAEQQEELRAEYSLIEQSKKYLSIILSAMQQSMQSITANFR